ncbi:dihydrolipoamide dehydrogenase [Nitrosospira multiformis ATCC 25196]|uniref:D-isomer specific 2-hydroxyacid dehydrogenase, NAD-binding protein n=1 Tax=Nitrosospira multiformis (strain ATCC 25196 / NCIMB 11849 / C 71) TaxID=323848 RepID=Q2Y7A2_NITMU|nr:D-isomer specific 2-hydroxyacid dehydrogenase, NAD-binding protein [Nitrosospira multiformis ATCC 25196]SEG06234.1 dihydrolipoamide dehydrogenase [Nitrosospira multiformis ATCC 25196]
MILAVQLAAQGGSTAFHTNSCNISDEEEILVSETFDVIIIGAGTAGLAALREVKKRTDNFAIINDGPWGTVCARVGCMPSKALIEAAKAFHRRTSFEEFGIQGAHCLTPDIAAVLRRVRRLRDDFVASTLKATEVLGERAISGRARLLEAGRLEVNGRELRARNIIIATGSRPVVPSPWLALDTQILTTDTLFEQKTLPDRVAIIGLGAVGVEMAQALGRLGIEVTAFSESDTIAGLSDPKVNAVAAELFADEFRVHLGKRADLRVADGGMRVTTGTQETAVDAVLASLGRRPNIENLGLETLGIPLNERGLPPVDPHTMQIADLPVFMAGDASGMRPLLHEAADEGHIAGINATHPTPIRFDRRTPLAIVFTDPGIAIVGKKHTSLPRGTLTGEVRFEPQSRARMAQRNDGILRIYAEPGSGKLLGAEMCSPDAEHMAHLLALAIDRSLTVHDMLRMPFYHPVLEEGLRTALRELSKQLPHCRESDLAGCEAFGAQALD